MIYVFIQFRNNFNSCNCFLSIVVVNVRIEQTGYTVGEGDGTFSPCAVHDDAIERNVEVTLSSLLIIGQSKLYTLCYVNYSTD